MATKTKKTGVEKKFIFNKDFRKFAPHFDIKIMPFRNQRNSRDDNSKRQRSNSESFKSKGGQGRNSSHAKGRSFEKPSFDREDRKPFNKDERKSFDRDDKRSFSKDDRKPFGKYERKPFSKDDRRPFNSSDERKPFGKSSKFGGSYTDRNEDKPYRKNFNTGRDKPYAKKFQKTEDNENTFKYSRGRKFSPAQKPAAAEAKDDGLIRLNRYISNAGICSRRKADELIAAGVVTVNGEVVTELGTKVDPAKDEIRYNNERLKREKMVYILLNKPKDYITTTDDPQERHTVMHLVAKATKERIYPVGRLDRNTTGLLLLTNDGNLAEKLSHPRNNVTKLYHVELDKNLNQGDFNKIEFGLQLEDGFIKPDDLSYIQGASKREVGIQIHSGKNRIVRRIFESLGYEIVKLDRVVYANLTKKNLPRGRWRYLDERELIQLKHFVK